MTYGVAKRGRARGLLTVCLVSASALLAPPPGAAQEASLAYPETRRQAIVETIFGETVADPYRWLEDGSAPEVATWSKAQDAFARRYLDGLPGRRDLAARLGELIAAPWTSTPYVVAGRLFYYKQLAGAEKAVLLWRDGEDGTERVLIDPNKLSSQAENVSLGRWGVSRDGRTIAYILKRNNADEGVLQVMDVASREVSEIDRLTGIRHSRIEWAADGSGFYYTHLPDDPGISPTERPGYAEIRFHRLGTPQAKDELVFGRTGDPTTFLRPRVSWDGRWLFVYVWYGWNGVDVFLRDLTATDAGFRPFFSSREARIWVEDHDGYFYIHSNEKAPNWQLFRVPAGVFDRAAWETVIAEPQDAVLDVVFVAGGRLLVRLHRDARHRLQVRALTGDLLHEVRLPGPGITRWMKGRPDQETAYYTFSSFSVPWTSYGLSMATGRSALWSKTDVPVDTAGYVTEQIWYRSKDGTRVPMFVVRREDMPRDGTTPFLLYGYGGFGIDVMPGFFAELYAWLEAGGGYAVPNLRGGGEFGEDWHRAGMALNKQNVFDDFIAAAETLIDKGYTSAKRLAIRGRSNGGLLVGAAMTQRPELFGAVLCGVPLLDMVRYTKLSVGKTWIEEYGSPEKERDFRVLYGYSPYHRLVSGTAYPPVLFVTADTDDRVDPAHARKMSAALQALNGGTTPVLLSIERQAGHGGADRIAARVSRWTDEYAFLMHLFGMTPKPHPASAR